MITIYYSYVTKSGEVKQGGFNVHNVIEEFLYTISKKGGE